MVDKSKSRYPGVNHFRREDKDTFFGRKEDSEKLYVQMMLSKTLVLHAESGTGKSSLIEAGLLPIIDKKESEQLSNQPNKALKFYPITIRLEFNKKESNKPQPADLLTNKIILKIYDSEPSI